MIGANMGVPHGKQTVDRAAFAICLSLSRDSRQGQTPRSTARLVTTITAAITTARHFDASVSMHDRHAFVITTTIRPRNREHKGDVAPAGSRITSGNEA